MDKIVITGVTGFIGKALAEKLLSTGNYVVYGVGRDSKKIQQLLLNDKFVFIEADYQDYDNLAGLIKAKDIKAFIHFAWMGYGKKTNDFRVQIKNIDATCRAVEAAEKLNCQRFIMACSCLEYQKDIRTDQINSIYGITKSSAAAYARCLAVKANMQYNGVIFSNIFGVGDYSNRSTNTLVRQMQMGVVPKLIEGNNLYDWTYIADAVNGVIAVLNKGKEGKEYYIGNSKLSKFKDIILAVKEVIAPDMELKFGEFLDNSYVDYALIDLNELYEDTGFKITGNFKEAIKLTDDWVRKINEEEN